ncbi:MAG: NAD(+)/NADH kinase [Muribaculaceae bacterium]|nr:NAD(+)/NADH kinase [Muribaculaceae bacterium]
MRIAVYGSRRQDNYLPEIEAFMRRLAQMGVEVVMHPKLYKYLQAVMLPALAAVRRVTDSSDFTADASVSIGGDGTFLRTAMWVSRSDIPILGVNTGHLGYMTALSVDRLSEVPELIMSGTLSYERRGLIEVVSPEIKTWPFALNEVTISKDDSASMIDAMTYLDGIHLADYCADGLIIATPTGSTAYNLSVGGPVIQPQTRVWVISPIAAHTLTMRPLVISDSSSLSILPQARAEHFRLTLDGRSVSLPVGTEIRLRRADFDVKVLHLPGSSFIETLRNKLHWGIEQ